MKEIGKRINFKEFISFVGFSRYRYSIPIRLPFYKIYPKSPEHTGRFSNAVDISVPNPLFDETIIYAPQSGVVTAVVLSNTRWGTTSENNRYLNYLNILVGGREFYEIAHITSLKDRVLKVGTRIEKGEPIAKASLNGRITITNDKPDSHIHILVGNWFRNNEDFRSLKIRWDENPHFQIIF